MTKAQMSMKICQASDSSARECDQMPPLSSRRKIKKETKIPVFKSFSVSSNGCSWSNFMGG